MKSFSETSRQGGKKPKKNITGRKIRIMRPKYTMVTSSKCVYTTSNWILGAATMRNERCEKWKFPSFLLNSCFWNEKFWLGEEEGALQRWLTMALSPKTKTFQPRKSNVIWSQAKWCVAGAFHKSTFSSQIIFCWSVKHSMAVELISSAAYECLFTMRWFHHFRTDKQGLLSVCMAEH